MTRPDQDATTPLSVYENEGGEAPTVAVAVPVDMPLTVPMPTVGSEAGAQQDAAASGKSALSDGLALSISGAVGSVAGLISWLIAARVMPQEAVGYATAFVSAFLLVAGVAQLNLDSAMMLWMPKSGKRAAALFWRSHAVIIPACAAVGLIYMLLAPEIARTGAGPDGSLWFGMFLFVIAAVGWGLWGVHDFSLVAIGKPWWASWRNIVFALVRIGLLVALGAGLGAQGIVLSWVIPIAVFTVGSAVLGGVYTAKFGNKATTGWLPSRSEAAKFLGPTTLAHWGTVLLFNQVTVIVVQRFGPIPGAAFFIAWQAVMVVDIAAQRFMQSLSAQLARDPEGAKAHIAASRKRIFVIFLPMVLVGIALADFGLQIFGPGYAEASTVLRVLLIGMIPRLVISHELGVRQAMNKGVAFARLQLISTFFVIAVVLFMPTGAVDASGQHDVASLLPVAIGYAVSQALCAVGVLALPLLKRLRGAPAA